MRINSLRFVALIADRRLVGCVTAALVCQVGLAQETRPPSESELFSKAARNVVAVVNWDKGSGRETLGSGVLLQRDYAITQCHILKNVKRVGVTQGQRRSEARLIRENRKRDLCEIVLLNPVHFNASPLKIRWLEDILVGEPVYAVGAPLGQDVQLIKGQLSGIRGSGEEKTIRISAKLTPGYKGGGLFDRSGSLIGITMLRGSGEGPSYVYPIQSFLEMKDTRTAAAQAPKDQATDAFEEEPPPIPLDSVKETSTVRRQTPKPPTDAKPEAHSPPVKEAKAEPSAAPPRLEIRSRKDTEYKTAIKEYLETIVRASTKKIIYPEDARRSNWAGTSSILFRMKSGGELSESYVDKSSGYATLDVTALMAVRKAIAEAPPPPIIKEKGMTATVAIAFVLPDK